MMNQGRLSHVGRINHNDYCGNNRSSPSLLATSISSSSSSSEDCSSESSLFTNEPQQQPTSETVTGPFGLQLSHVIFAASMPFCIGAYSGYRKQLKEAEKDAREASARMAAGKDPLPDFRLRAEARSLGARALGIATLLSVGSFGLVTAVSLYAGGFRSFQQVLDSCNTYGRKRRIAIEEWAGIDVLNRNDPDRIATQHMSEEEEMDYVMKKYFPDSIMEEPSTKDA